MPEIVQDSSLLTIANDTLGDICHFLNKTDIKNFQDTCRFFHNSEILKKKFSEKPDDWQIFPSNNSAILLSSQGHAFGEGINSSGKLGISKCTDRYISLAPIYLPNKLPINKIIAGNEHTFFFDIEGSCFYSGKNLLYTFNRCQQTGLPYTIATPRELILPNGNKISAITTGPSFWGESVFIIDSENNCYRYIPVSDHLHTNESLLKPFTLPNNKLILRIAAGSNHQLFLDEDLQCHGMGANHEGQLGLDCDMAKEPLPMYLRKKISRIFAFSHRSFLMTIDGEVYGTGSNFYGELGRSCPSYADEFIRIELPNKIPIVDIKGSGKNTFFKNKKGDWFFCGEHPYAGLQYENNWNNKAIKVPSRIQLPNQQRIRTIELSEKDAYLIDDKGSLYRLSKNQFVCLDETLHKYLDNKKAVTDDKKVTSLQAKP